MKQVLKIFKKSLFPVIIVIFLLVIQAMCDLKIPDYTANIINIGIQQGGIEDDLYDVVRQKELDKITMFMDEKDKSTIYESYSLLDRNKLTKKDYQNYVKKYPLLEHENIYILNDISKEEKTKLEGIIKIPSLIVSNLNSKNENIVKVLGKDNPLLGENNYEVIVNLPQKQLDKIRSTFEEQFKKIDANFLNQMGINNVKDEYTKIGVDTKRIQIEYIVYTGLKMIALTFIVMIIAITVTYMASRIGAKFSRDLRSSVVNKVMNFSNKEFEEISTSSLITRSTNDIMQIQMLIIMVLRIVIYAPILGLGALAKVSNNEMSWVIGVAVLAIISLVITLLVIAMPKFQLLQKLIDKLNLVSRQILTGILAIRSFSNEKHEEKNFDEANKDLSKTYLFVNRAMAIMMPSMMFVMNSVAILIIWVGASKVDMGSMQVGTLMAFITYTMQIIMSFLMLSMMSIMLPRAWVSVKRISEIFNKPLSVTESKNPQSFTKIKGDIEFKEVYFRYPDAEEDVLENISFTAKAGTVTAFIGSTGSGKSTLINLIPRFYDVTGGEILIDGINIKDVSLNDLRSKIGYVPQKGMLLSGTIASNIGFSEDDMDIKQIKNAAKIAQARDFIEDKEGGYEAPVSQGGTNLSGGQKQRVAIARAIAKDPNIYIFDDSFSALDYKTDVTLRKELATITKDKTVLIVAQRISTVISADKIVVIDDGIVVGTGTHKELLKNCEVYKEIALSQLSKEELQDEQ